MKDEVRFCGRGVKAQRIEQSEVGGAGLERLRATKGTTSCECEGEGSVRDVWRRPG